MLRPETIYLPHREVLQLFMEKTEIPRKFRILSPTKSPLAWIISHYGYDEGIYCIGHYYEELDVRIHGWPLARLPKWCIIFQRRLYQRFDVFPHKKYYLEEPGRRYCIGKLETIELLEESNVENDL